MNANPPEWGCKRGQTNRIKGGRGMRKEFKILVIPAHLNPGAPEGETLVLLFSFEEMERARQRGESVIRKCIEGGMNRDEAIASFGGGIKLS
jgi:hypothetical protein